MGTKFETTIGLIGKGAIGSAIVEAVETGALSGFALTAGLARSAPSDGSGGIWTNNLETFLAKAPDIVIEAAGPEAFSEIVPIILASGLDVIAVSVAAMADGDVEAKIRDAITTSGARLHVASGAIGALDALSAAREMGLESVELVQRKPYNAFPNIDLTPGTTQVVSSGSARDAAIAFPRNSNIAAAAALAGLGFDDTRVTVIADHEVTTNQAELKVRGQFGQFVLTIQNYPSAANPRTATLTALSVISALRRTRAPIVIPA
ncbi:aspartate dehydrogenase [Pseudoruegeria sp. SK021]|uniref:aspartate dehydrogenase n=1 Tax=Pseudoruegeria sp. SK021 TaxID=1933035 RepID=UPI000A21D5C7|nr:aspartate dehydrogenase [Pseudoruegeria sp. SK021]OSP53473.1 hypothetical protein BV911_17845 [Pseudoruegeria sp. SK021]